MLIISNVLLSVPMHLFGAARFTARYVRAVRAIMCGVFGTDSFLARPRQMFLVGSVARGMEMLWHGWLPGLSGAGERDPFGQLACCELERRLGAYPVDGSSFWTPLECWDADDIALEMSDALLLIVGRMAVGRTSLRLVGLKWLVLVFICLQQKLLLILRFGELLKSMVMLVWSVAVLSCPSLGLCRLFSVPNSGVPLLPCRRIGHVI